MAPRFEAESVRKWLHLLPGGLALLLPWTGRWGALALLAALLAFNLWFFPRLGGRALWRDAERLRGEAPAMIFYPLSLLTLAVAAGERLEILAGAWGMLAFGDAAATLVGQRWGSRRLPWNRDKTWLGSGALVVAAWSSAAVLVYWVAAEERYSVADIALAAGLAAVVAGLVESLRWPLDDNVSVTLIGGAALFAGLEVGSAAAFDPRAPWLLGSGVVATLAVATYATRSLDLAGSLAGAAVALAIWLGGGWGSLVLLAIFVGVGTMVGRWRRAAGARPSRGLRNVLANGAVAAGCGLAAAFGGGAWALVALVGALATAVADTVGGEIGRGLGGGTRRLSDGAPVAPGANGGVSWAGSAATAMAAAAIGALAWILGVLPLAGAVAVGLAGTTAAFVDSLLGATLEEAGLIDNEGVNFLSTLTGAWLAAQTWVLWL